MVAELLVKYILSDSTAPRMAIIPHCQTIGQLIAFVARAQGVDVGIVSVNDYILNDDDSLGAFCDSQNQLFAFSKSESRPLVSLRS
jgi:hypothetical protein